MSSGFLRTLIRAHTASTGTPIDMTRPSSSHSPSGEQDPRPLRVLHVLAPAPVGGLEEVVRSLAVGLGERGHDVHVAACVTRNGHPFVDALAADGVSVHPVVFSARDYLGERRRIRELCRTLDPDVVHTHGHRSDVVHSGVARKLGHSIVTTVHGFTGGDWKNRLYQRIQLHRFRSFDAVVAVSAPLARRLVDGGVPDELIHVIRNAWRGRPVLSRSEARSELGLSGNAFSVAWVGRASREKGLDVFLDAVRSSAAPPLVAVVVGDGPERPRLQESVEADPHPSPVRFLGTVPRIAPLLSAFDALVLSSRTEGTPMILFEAVAAGVPVVATRVGGVPDVLTSNEAILVDPENPSAIARALTRICEDPEAARARAVAAKRRIEERFSSESWLKEHERLYRRIA